MAKPDFDAAYEAMLANPPEHPYRYFYETGHAHAYQSGEAFWAADCSVCGRPRKDGASICSAPHVDIASYHAGREAGAAYWEQRWVDLYEVAWAFLVANNLLLAGINVEEGTIPAPTHEHYKAAKQALKEALKQ